VNEILRRGIYWDKSIFYSKSIKDIIKKMVTIYEKNMKMLERKKVQLICIMFMFMLRDTCELLSYLVQCFTLLRKRNFEIF